MPIIPLEQGEIIYHYNEKSPNQLYIIGMGHRDTLTGLNGINTVKTQVEVYRICEWLIRNRGLELLLPEGFFLNNRGDAKRDKKAFALEEKKRQASLDNKALEEKLGDEKIFVNAEMLLMESHDIEGRQVEDLNFYNAAREKVSQLEHNSNNDYSRLLTRAVLVYLQERRTAAMLQNIPEVIDSEYREGRIKNKNAIFTIGINHISGIIKYLKQNKITIYSPAFTTFNDYFSGVNLLDENFGITIIIPRTLSDYRNLIKLSELESQQHYLER